MCVPERVTGAMLTHLTFCSRLQVKEREQAAAKQLDEDPSFADQMGDMLFKMLDEVEQRARQQCTRVEWLRSRVRLGNGDENGRSDDGAPPCLERTLRMTELWCAL